MFDRAAAPRLILGELVGNHPRIDFVCMGSGAKLEIMGGGCRVHTTSSRYSDSYSHSITNPQFLTSKLNFNNGNIILVTSQYIIHTQIGRG